MSSCIASNKVVHYWNLKYLTDNGWKACYNQPYSANTYVTDLIDSCPTGQDYYLFVAALSTHKSQYALLGAYAPSQVLTDFTTSTAIAKLPNEYANTNYSVYWYNYLPGSGYTMAFGFSSNQSISLVNSNVNNYGWYSWDSATSYGEDRLSWSYTKGGYRAGSVYPGYWNTIYRKVIYYKQCNDSNMTTEPVTSTPGNISNCIASTSVVHNWNLNYLYSNGWKVCYNEYYSHNTYITNLIPNCPTGQEYYLFVAALSTNKSQYALVGAYAPSRVLTEFTTSSKIAMIPSEYEDTEYNIYWYNYMPGSGNTRFDYLQYVYVSKYVH